MSEFFLKNRHLLGFDNAKKALLTTVREAGSGTATAFALRRGTAEGMVAGPRIVAAGPALAIIGGHGDVNGFRPEVNELLDSGFTCTGVVECAASAGGDGRGDPLSEIALAIKGGV